MRSFGYELLCLLMVLHGPPILALTSASATGKPRAAVESEEEPGPSAEEGPTGESWWSSAHDRGEAIGSRLHGAVSGVAGQPWLGAFSVLLATAGFEEEDPPPARRSPPSPPGLTSPRQPAGIPGFNARDAHLESSPLDEIPLLAGWNLVSLPEEPADSDPAEVLSALGGALVKAWTNDGCDAADPWKLYDPADPGASDLDAIDHRAGLWIETTAPVPLPSTGTLPATTSIELCAGWNLIGFPAGQPRHPRNALQSIEGKYLRIFGYDAADAEDPWEIYDVAVPAWANDLEVLQPGRGYWILVSEDVTLEIANQGAAPVIALASPVDLTEVTTFTDIVGTVQSEILESWELTYEAVGDGEPVVFASGNFPIADGVLGTFDPTLLLNGLYELTLTATDVHGVSISESLAVAVEGQQKIGNFTLSFVDLAIPLSGLDLEVVRTYDSRDLETRDFGFGWSLDIRQGTYRNNRPPGEGWVFETGFVPCDTTVESKSHLTVVRLSDQEVYRFALRLADGVPEIGGCVARARFEYVDGPLPGTTLEILGNDLVFWGNGSDQVLDQDTLSVFEPRDVRLTTRDGRIFELDLVDGVELLEDLNGNQVTITPDGITHSSGRGIAFERDAEGRIEKIIDPLEQTLLYAYDEAGDLRSFTNQAEHTTRFVYEDHRIVDIFDPRGIRAVRNDYDAEGRLRSVTDALGHSLLLEHDLEASQEILTDRLGFVKVLTYDARGNIVEEINEAGKKTVRTFDGNDQLLTETDPNQNTSTNVYDTDGNLLSVEDPLGNASRFGDHDALGTPQTLTDPRGKVTKNTFDAQGNLRTTEDPLGNLTVFTYDSRGQLETEIDADQKVTTFSYDAFGNLTKVTDALGHEVVSSYDELGNLRSQTVTRTLPDGTAEALTTTFTVDELGRTTRIDLPDGSFTETRYGLLGEVIETRDALQRVTSFEYDDAGRQTKTTYPDTTFEERTYDLEGRLLTLRDRGGQVTTFEYDPVGRLTKTILPGGAFSERIYDDAGRLVTSIDLRGFATHFGYDKADRRTTVTDALQNITTFRYDAAGNRTEVEDALGRITHFGYDDAGRLEKTTLPDGKSIVTEYDALGRRTAEIDQALVRTELRYDALGRLVEVNDALEGATTYGYDELGHRTSQTDANDHTTRFEYDALGRQTKRILPDGSFEVFTYDAAGNRATRTDFKGVTTTYEHDSDGRLLRRSYPGGSSLSVTYTPSGRRKTVSDARGVTRYFYDERDRLVRQVMPEGWELSYTWDAAGNRTSISALLAGGASFGTTYTYDELGRMKTVTDSRGGVYTYSYDAAGQRKSLSHPNGVVTSYDHDLAGRLKELRTETSSGEVLQSYAYTLGPTGNREAVTEQDGTIRSYQYDLLYRLRNERVETAAGALVYQNVFGYDAVGNRLSQDRTAADGTVEPVVYTYDTRDRLLAESSVAGGGARDLVYGWDANGNQVSKSGTGPAGEVVDTGYEWDFENRLVEVLLADGTVTSHTYDADGVWLGERVIDGEETVQTGWLVDLSRSLSQVVGEIDGDGNLVAELARGGPTVGADELVGLLPVGELALAYHLDGLGSVRTLSDPASTVSDRRDYEAFGLPVQDSRPPGRFGFAAEQQTSQGTYLRARWLSPDNARFLSLDPANPRSLVNLSDLHRYVYARNSPLDRLDPAGLESLASQLTALTIQVGGRIQQFGVQRLTAFAGGASAGWKYLRQLGKFAEGTFRQVVQLYSASASSPLRLSNGTRLVGSIRSAPDFFIRTSNGLRRALVEVKWGLPWARTSEPMVRLVNQVRVGLQTGADNFVIWSLRAPTVRQVALLERTLGINYQFVQVVHGVNGLFLWLNRTYGRIY